MQVLVLNNDYSPISVTDMIRGFKLVFKGKAEIIEHVEDNPIVTETQTYKRPSVIRLLRYVVLPYKKIKPSRENIFKRDEMKCVYCDSNRNLTIDHVLPRSRGGENTWENLVACCTRCNGRKGDRTPEEAGMKMRHAPFKPGYGFFVRRMVRNSENWEDYIPE